jgi:uncharacterized membrane protein YbaN (DUF454 family)
VITITMQKAPSPRSNKQRVVKGLLLVGGTVSLVLGAVGIFLPILPTTPFLLLSAACYLRSSERMYKWLLGNRWFGEYIKNYQEGRGIPAKTKMVALVILWAAIFYSTLMVVDEILIAQIALLAIAVGVSVHLVRIPTYRK